MQHLDLSGTGLSKDMILDVVRAVLSSPSMLAIHLSANPGVCSKLVNTVV
jgi:hypothetical protein